MDNTLQKTRARLALFTMLLALGVVMLGAYTRLSDAGLGCPDWPGCYGKILVPASVDPHMQNHWPDMPLESRKAWTEMAHRYVAGTLGLLVLLQGALAIVARKRRLSATTLPFVLSILIVLQALLGMWTVTLKLLPIVVMAHLLGGMLLFSGLFVLTLQLYGKFPASGGCPRILALLCVFAAFFQIALGGWVSANYAGMACIGFPTCNGHWWMAPDFSQGFHLFSPAGANYQGGLLDVGARITIQFVHRLCALAVLLLVVLQAWRLRKEHGITRRFVRLSLVLLVAQIILGVVNVTQSLPLWSAVAHNGVAALLLASLIAIALSSRREVCHG
ncbi:cytochrome c oxidase assembly protein [Legionella geestiana]|uniref:Cytochrome c oxidase assembly protein n=1 Tax=Legionella geestiana TaxID=45065 RepID=A0A0W0TTW3_9GAMM|nr:COX15/CtaA family protein [Legionella geestiana]KTC98956.1 cytochrome c oxidase assembly protein [Legionella geestiana]QBS13045.1 heme A synthase [Legionella geestiana]QDQ39275.1 heme A synthase [Legionella geestiana]STX54442.1 cytochrome c oxidase assembly protein [Legionella geestiana]